MRSVSKAIVGSYLALSVIGWVMRAYNIASRFSTAHSDPTLLVVVTTETPKWAVWTALTAPFVELEILPFTLSTLVLWTGGRYCERIWSSRKYLVFVAICLCPNILMILFYSFVSLVNNKEYRINGMASLAAGIAVALKQLVSEHVILLFQGRLRLKIKWVPSFFLVFLPILDLCGLYDNSLAFFLGFIISWGYLRFYQTLPETVDRTRMVSRPFIRGDASDAFAFAKFFPEPIAAVVSRATQPIYVLALKIRAIPPFTVQQIQTANQRYATRLSGSVLPVYATTRTTVERRRAMLESLD